MYYKESFRHNIHKNTLKFRQFHFFQNCLRHIRHNVPIYVYFKTEVNIKITSLSSNTVLFFLKCLIFYSHSSITSSSFFASHKDIRLYHIKQWCYFFFKINCILFYKLFAEIGSFKHILLYLKIYNYINLVS